MAEPAVISGVTVEQYAGITAALAEGLPLGAALEHEGLSPPRWRPIDAAWKARLAADGPEGALFKVFSDRRAEAEDWLGRSVAPLDHDLRAWLSFLDAWGKHAAPFEMLAAAGLRLSDVSRLRRRWARRFEEERELQKKASEIAKKGHGPVPALSVGEIEHKPYPWSRGRPAGTKAAVTAESEPPRAPVSEPPPDPADAAPRPLLVPSFMKQREAAQAFSPPPVAAPADPPRPLGKTPVGGTVEFDLSSLRASLPFGGKASDDVALPRAKDASAAERPRSGSAPVAGMGATGDVPADLLARAAGARLPFRREGAPREDEQARSPREDEQARSPREAKQGSSPREAEQDSSPREAEQGGSPREASPAAAAPPTPMSTGTVELSADLLKRVAGAPLPFAKQAPSASPAPGTPMPAETIDLPAGLVQKIIAGAPPFRAKVGSPARAPSPAAAPAPSPAPAHTPAAVRLTLEQYASYRAELAVFNDRNDAVLARYGLTEPGRRALEERGWEERLRLRPDQRARFEQLHRSYLQYWAARAPR